MRTSATPDRVRTAATPDRMHVLILQVTSSTYQVLCKNAKPLLVKPEDIAQAAIEDYVRHAVQLDRRFRDAIVEVERRLGSV